MSLPFTPQATGPLQSGSPVTVHTSTGNKDGYWDGYQAQIRK
jgi:hypothetical protein